MDQAINVLAFAGARDVIGAAELRLELGCAECSADEVMDKLCALYPALSAHRSSIRMAVNECYVKGDERVRPGDEVALIPPVAGG